MYIKPNEDGTYTLVCPNGYTYTGTYQECDSKVTKIIDAAIKSERGKQTNDYSKRNL
jgi:hypothetical protein